MSLLNDVTQLLESAEDFGSLSISTDSVSFNPQIYQSHFVIDFGDSIDRKIWDITDPDIRKKAMVQFNSGRSKLNDDYNNSINKISKIYVELVKAEMTKLVLDLNKLGDSV